MSEKLQANSPEQQRNSPEASSEQSRKNIERIKQLAEQEKGISEDQLEKIKQSVESESISREDIRSRTESEQPKAPLQYNQKELKAASFNKTLAQVRSKLPAPERALSKIVHQKTVEKISDIGSKTVARPSGIMGGGLLALLGSSFVLIIAKRYGFAYNYSLIILLYIGGFAIGIIVELLTKKLFSTRK